MNKNVHRPSLCLANLCDLVLSPKRDVTGNSVGLFVFVFFLLCEENIPTKKLEIAKIPNAGLLKK